MLDLNRTMFYKTEFNILAPKGQDALWSVVLKIRGWIADKARRSSYRFPCDNATWTSLKNGARAKAEGADVEMYSSLHIEEGVYTWACRFAENVDLKDGSAPRQWLTEVGFKGRSLEEGTFSLVLSYSDRAGFIGPLQAVPGRSIPKLVDYLLKDDALDCTVSGINVKSGPVEVGSENAQEMLGIIANTDRGIPVVFASPGTLGQPLVDPHELHRALGPNALVCYATGLQAAEAMNSLLKPLRLACFGGAVRVYATQPRVDEPLDHARHRFVAASAIREHGEDYVVDMLRRALAQDVHFWQSMLRVDDVKHLNRESVRERRIAELKRRFQDEALEEMLSAEEATEALKQESDLAREENSQLREEVHNLRARCQSYEAAFAGASASDGEGRLAEIVRAARRLPPATAEETARRAVAAFPDRIDFTERGWDSCGECRTDSAVLWAAIHDMCTILHPLYAGSESVDMAREFNSRSTFSLARGEGRMTRKSPKTMASRKDVYQGRDIFIEPHVKSSTGNQKDPSFVRIYFDWDEASGKLVVGDCGGHLENHSTRSVR